MVTRGTRRAAGGPGGRIRVRLIPDTDARPHHPHTQRVVIQGPDGWPQGGLLDRAIARYSDIIVNASVRRLSLSGPLVSWGARANPAD